MARINSGAKGKRGEREFCAAMKEAGHDCTRNLDQTRAGGHDIKGLEDLGWAPEIKRQETLCIDAWWKQACEQATAVDKRPVLAYRKNRQPWRVIVKLSEINPIFAESLTCTIELPAFIQLLEKGAPCR